VSDALDNVRALVKHLKPQSCDGTCLEAMGRQMLAVFAMCGMYITNVHPAYHEKLALQLQEDLIREEEEKNQKAQQKKVGRVDACVSLLLAGVYETRTPPLAPHKFRA
jgi:hypothetical protein